MENQDHSQISFEDLKYKTRKVHPVILVCDEVTDAKNIGSIIRLADAACIEKLIFVSQNPPTSYRKIDKVARSTRHSVNPIFCTKKELYDHVPGQYEWLAIEITKSSIPYKEYEAKGPIILVLGSEIYGVSDPILDRCKTVIHVPMYGLNSSMNVAMAGAIVVYNLLDQF